MGNVRAGGAAEQVPCVFQVLCRMGQGGRLTADPELKTTPAGLSVTPFTIAVNNPGKDAGTSFINCVAWRKTAEFVSKYFRKGASIVVEGTLNQRSFTDNSGNKRSTTEVVVSTAHFVDSRNGSQNDQSEEPQFETLSDGEDLPF